MMSTTNVKLHILHRCRHTFILRFTQFHFHKSWPINYVNLDQEVKKRPYSSLTALKRKTNLGVFSRLKCPSCQHYRIQERSYASDIMQVMSTLGFTCFTTIHSLTGTPWWLSIALVVLPIRTGVQVFNEIISRRNEQKVADVHIHLQQIGGKYRKEFEKKEPGKIKQINGLDQAAFDSMMNKYRKRLYVSYQCHPLQPLVAPLLYFPIWLTMSCSLREMSAGKMLFGIDPRPEYYQSSLESEGLLWFPDLVQPDPFCILPIMTGLSMLTSVEIRVLKSMSLRQKGEKESRSVKRILVVPRLLSVLIMTVGALVPSAMTYYWCLSSVSANIVTLTLLSPKVMKKLNIKRPKTASNSPFIDIYDAMKIRYVENPVNWCLSKISKSRKMLKKDSKNNNTKEG